MEFLGAIHALMNRGSFLLLLPDCEAGFANAIHNKDGNALLCCKPLAYTHATHRFCLSAKLWRHSANESASSLACLIAHANSLRAICRRIASTACVPSQAPFPQVSSKWKLAKIGLHGAYPPDPLKSKKQPPDTAYL